MTVTKSKENCIMLSYYWPNSEYPSIVVDVLRGGSKNPRILRTSYMEGPKLLSTSDCVNDAFSVPLLTTSSLLHTNSF